MSSTLDQLNKHVERLGQIIAERKSHLVNVRENIEKLKAEEEAVENQLKEFTGGIAAYNESIRLLTEESADVTPKLQAVPEAEVIDAEVATEAVSEQGA